MFLEDVVGLMVEELLLCIVLDWMLSYGTQEGHSRRLVLQRESSDDRAEFWSVHGKIMSTRWTEPKFDQLEMSATGMQTSLKYVVPKPQTQSKAISATHLELYSSKHRQPVEDITKDRSDVVKLAGTNNQTGGGAKQSADGVWLVLIRRIKRCYNSQPWSHATKDTAIVRRASVVMDRRTLRSCHSW